LRSVLLCLKDATLFITIIFKKEMVYFKQQPCMNQKRLETIGILSGNLVDQFY